jgi:hypothetical protein
MNFQNDDTKPIKYDQQFLIHLDNRHSPSNWYKGGRHWYPRGNGPKPFGHALHDFFWAATRRGNLIEHFVYFWAEMMRPKSFIRVALCTFVAVLMLASGKAKAMEMEILTPSEFTHTYMKTRPTVSKWNTGLFPQSTLEWIIRHENLLRDKVSLVMQDKPVPFMPKNVFCSSADFVHGRAACMAVTGINTAHLRYEIHLNPQMLHVWSRFDVNQHLANMNRYTREHNFDGMAYEIVAVMQFIIENF